MNSKEVNKMSGRFLPNSKRAFPGGNIYADKSSIVLDWLLSIGIDKERFALREVAKDRDVSVGLVQRVFELLVANGLLHTEGVRTAKRFFLKNPELLLKSWLEHYSIIKKCKIWTYRSGFQGKAEILQVLEKSSLRPKVALALHSAADAYGYKNTNLQTLELYMIDPAIRRELEEVLQLEPQEKGYEVLLIEPYYKSLLNMHKVSPLLLTFLDLYNFPLRGQEQAEFMVERAQDLKRIYKRKKNGS